MTTIYRAADSTYTGPECGFQWWATERAWALRYGSEIVTRDGAALTLLDLPLDGPDVRDALETAGIECDDIAFEMSVGDDETLLDLEVHQILASEFDGPTLAARLRAAGYDGVTHPDHHLDDVGEAVALLV